MKNKFKIGNLIKRTPDHPTKPNSLGIVLKTGVGRPNSAQKNQPYALIHWDDGSSWRLYKNYGQGYRTSSVVAS